MSIIFAFHLIVNQLSVHTNLEYRQIMSMTRAFCRKQRFQDAENFLMEMETLGKPMNIAPYNMLLAAHMRAGHAHSANAFFTRMRDRPNGPKPDQITYGILIRVHGKTKQVTQTPPKERRNEETLCRVLRCMLCFTVVTMLFFHDCGFSGCLFSPPDL